MGDLPLDEELSLTLTEDDDCEETSPSSQALAAPSDVATSAKGNACVE